MAPTIKRSIRQRRLMPSRPRREIQAICWPICYRLRPPLCCGNERSSTQAAEQAVKDFYTAFFQKRWVQAARLFHPDGLKTIKRLLIHIASTTKNPKERKEFLETVGVKSIWELQKMDPETAFVELFEVAS